MAARTSEPRPDPNQLLELADEEERRRDRGRAERAEAGGTRLVLELPLGTVGEGKAP